MELFVVFLKARDGASCAWHRSIICSAGVEKAVKTLNLKVKKREFFRPLAPMMLKNLQKNIFILIPIHSNHMNGWR